MIDKRNNGRSRYTLYGGLEYFYSGASMASLLNYYIPSIYNDLRMCREGVSANIVGTMWVCGEYL